MFLVRHDQERVAQISYERMCLIHVQALKDLSKKLQAKDEELSLTQTQLVARCI